MTSEGHKYQAEIEQHMGEALKCDSSLDTQRRVFAAEKKAMKAVTSEFEKTEDGVFFNPDNGTAILGRSGLLKTTGAICFSIKEKGELVPVGMTGLVIGGYSWLIGSPLEGVVFSLEGFEELGPEEIDLLFWQSYAGFCDGFRRVEDLEELFDR